MPLSGDFIRVILIGVGATAVMDLWLAFLRQMGVPTPDFALIGRWVGYLFRGRFRQFSIGKARPIAGEITLGWLTHYAVGVAFAGLLVAIQGFDWTRNPSVLPAVIVGMVTVVAPLFVMQPAMGAGFAASKTPTPFKNCLRSAINHTVFGVGLYLSAIGVEWISRDPLNEGRSSTQRTPMASPQTQIASSDDARAAHRAAQREGAGRSSLADIAPIRS